MLHLSDGRDHGYMWDTGRKLKCDAGLRDGTTVFFMLPGRYDPIPMAVENGTVPVPDEAWHKEGKFIVFLYAMDSTGRYTRTSRTFTVKYAPKPNNYAYTPTEVLDWHTLEARIEELEGEGLANAVAAYLQENPVEAGATAEEAAQIEQNKTDIATLGRTKLAASELPNAVNEALAQAKASGEFDGEPGKDGADGQPGADGKDYVLTEADKQEIAEQAAGMVEVPEGSGIDVTGAEVGQIIKVSAVDGNGKPTAWEAVDMPKSAQADWNQNDETAADYVKNRPFYAEDPVETVLFDGTVRKESEEEVFVEFTEGQDYTVILDGVEYVLTAWKDGEVYLGSPSVFGEYIDTEPPFFIGYGGFYTVNEGAQHTLKIISMEQPTHRIAPKYLPPAVSFQKYHSDEEGWETITPITSTLTVYSDFDTLNNPDCVTVNEEGCLFVPGALGGNISAALVSDYIGVTCYKTQAVGYSVTRNNVGVKDAIEQQGIGPYTCLLVYVCLSEDNVTSGYSRPNYVVTLNQCAKDNWNKSEIEWTGMFSAVDGSIWSVYANRVTDDTVNITVTKRL